MRTNLFLTLCAFGICQLSQADPAYLTVELNNGSNYSFELNETPEISYEDDMLIVNDEESTSYEIKDVKNFVFSDNEVNKSKLLDESNNLKVVSLSEELVHIEGLGCNADVTLYNINGSLVSTTNANDDGVVEIILPAQKGIYMISDGHHTVKVRRR
ncbi:MAG: hypothetical protein MJZ24_03455 [Paludibacteraceae bacterium]|nr:hypothetical protein [Candidatus Physcocola equi]MCQ2233782.1 hypothetical protein [Paludibacteraceae bacterium]